MALLFLVLLLGGCAPWSSHGVTAYPGSRKLRIAVLPVRSDIEVRSLTDIETVPKTALPVPDEQEQIRERMQKVTEEMTRSLEARLAASPYFEVVPQEQVADALQAESAGPSAPLTTAQIQGLAAKTGAGAVLVVRLSGYGRLKSRWVAYLIGSGVVEGVTEGAIAFGAVKNLWVGLGVALEEIGQEVLTWGGGSYLFNRYYAPVTIEGELVSASDGKEVWSDTAFDSIDRKALKKLPKEEQEKKEVQLRVTMEKAERDLADSLEKAAKKNLGTALPDSPP